MSISITPRPGVSYTYPTTERGVWAAIEVYAPITTSDGFFEMAWIRYVTFVAAFCLTLTLVEMRPGDGMASGRKDVRVECRAAKLC